MVPVHDCLFAHRSALAGAERCRSSACQRGECWVPQISRWTSLLSSSQGDNPATPQVHRRPIQNHRHKDGAPVRLGIGVVIFIAAYIGSLVLYVNGGMGRPQQIADSQSSSTATRVVVDIEDIQSNNGVLIAIVIVSPGPALLDPQTRNLKDDLSVVATSVVTASKHTWSKGEVPDVFRITMPLFGDVADWPFDRYQSGPINVQLFSGPGQVPEQVLTVSLDDDHGVAVRH